MQKGTAKKPIGKLKWNSKKYWIDTLKQGRKK